VRWAGAATTRTATDSPPATKRDAVGSNPTAGLAYGPTIQPLKVKTMINSRPSSRQLRDFAQALQAAQQAPRVTDSWLAELAARRDAYQSSLR
jgi:hypothetical protein